jgi:RecA-family ATPase
MLQEKEDNTSPKIENEATKNVMPQGFYTAKQLKDLRINKIPFLWEDIFPQQGVGFITGPSDTNKSTFLRQMADAIVQKKNEFLGRRLNVRHGRALIVSMEDNNIAISAILNKQPETQTSDVHLNQLFFYFNRFRKLDVLERMIIENPIDLLGLDTWTDNFHGDLNSSVAVRENINELNELANKYGFLVIGIHHVKKGSDNQSPHKGQMLGSTGIENHTRCVIDIRREGGESKRKLTIVKGNYTSDEIKKRPIYLELDPETMTLSVSEPNSNYGFEKFKGDYNKEKEVYMATIIEMYEKGHSQDETVKHLEEGYPDRKTPSKGTVNKWLQEWKQKNEQSDKQ